MITKEIFEKLIPFEEIFDRAVNQNYFRALATAHKEELHKLYNEVFGGGSKIIHGCGSCTLADLKKLGNEYYKFKASQEEQEEVNIKNDILEEFVTGGSTISNETVVIEKPKKGRPKKEK